MAPEEYSIRFFFDYAGFCLWSGNEKTTAKFGSPIHPEKLPLSPETIRRVREVCDWFDRSLHWDYPPDLGPWRQEECDRFNRAAKQQQMVIEKQKHETSREQRKRRIRNRMVYNDWGLYGFVQMLTYKCLRFGKALSML